MNNYQRYRERALKRDKKRYRHFHDLAMTHYGGDDPACVCCRVQANEFLHVADSSGNTRQDVITHPTHYPEGLQLLCWNCSHCMRMYDECLHMRPIEDC